MRPRFPSPRIGLGLIGRMAKQVRTEDVMPGVRVRMAFALG